MFVWDQGGYSAMPQDYFSYILQSFDIGRDKFNDLLDTFYGVDFSFGKVLIFAAAL